MDACIRSGNIDTLKCLSNECSIKDLEHAMKLCIKYGHLSLIEYLYSQGVRIRHTYLSMAVFYKHLPIIQYLYSVGIKVNYVYWMPINIASGAGEYQMLDYMLTHTSGVAKRLPIYINKLNKALAFILRKRTYMSEIIHVLLNHGATDYIDWVYICAVENNDKTMIERVLSMVSKIDITGQIDRAIQSEDQAIVKYLLFNYEGDKLGRLSIAIKTGHISIVAMLIHEFNIKPTYTIFDNVLDSQCLKEACKVNPRMFKYIVDFILDDLQYSGDQRQQYLINTYRKYLGKQNTTL